jgi:hypothetical protein
MICPRVGSDGLSVGFAGVRTTSSFTRDTSQGVADEARRTATTIAAFLAQADKTLRDDAVGQAESNRDDEVVSEPEENGLR